MTMPPDDRVGSALTGIGPKLEGIAARALGLVLALCLAGLVGLLTFDAVAAALGAVTGGGMVRGHAVVRGALERAGWNDPGVSGDASIRLAGRPDCSPLGAETGRRISMSEGSAYPPVTRDLTEARRALAPEVEEAFRAFSQKVFADGALPAKTKQLIAVAVAHVTQCPYCIKDHAKAARRYGATPEEIMEAIWVAAEMRAGGAVAHATLALAELGVGKTTGDGPGPG